MFVDVCQSQVSLSEAETVKEWDALIRAFLAHGTEAPVHLGRVLEREPGFAMAHAAKSLFSMMMGRRELVDVARDAARAARQALAAGGATKRERLWVDAAEAWLKGKPSAAIGCMEAALRLNPADTFSMKVSHAIRFILGDSRGMRRSIERVIGAHDDSHVLNGYAHGCYAFALEETGDYQAAEAAGLRALRSAGDDAWGMHAVAHVYDMTHRPDQGIDLIENNTAAWDHCNNFRFHVWWHKALLHLDRGEYDLVLGLYDTCIRHEKTDDYRDFSNASSLLTRLELDGIDVGQRWGELADLAESRSDDGCLVFADLHYMLALAGDNRTDAATRLVARVARDAHGTSDMAAVMDDPGRLAASGLAYFGEGRYDLAYQHLSSAQPRFQDMGGSHAQRDVFERVTIDAALRAGRLEAAEQLIVSRVNLRKGATDTFAASRLRTIAEAREINQMVAAE